MKNFEVLDHETGQYYDPKDGMVIEWVAGEMKYCSVPNKILYNFSIIYKSGK